MTERPILFSAPMVRALLAGRKTMTRRVVKPRHDWHVDEVPDERGVFRPWPVFEAYVYAEPETVEVPCPYGVPGDRLWVKETFGRLVNAGVRVVYRADGEPTDRFSGDVINGMKWTPSIHMPRGLSRITLEVTAVRVERLQAISEGDARAEGCSGFDPEPVAEGGTIFCRPGISSAPDPRAHFRVLWDTINGGTASWAANPWVWVVEFKRVTS